MIFNGQAHDRISTVNGPDLLRIKKDWVKSLFNNKCYRQGGQSSGRFSHVMRELWGPITTEERAERCRRMTEGR